MIGTVFVAGLMTFLAFWFLLMKLPVETRLKMLGYPFLMDLTISAFVLVIFSAAGSTTGLLSAIFAGLILSVSISAARKWIGWIKGGRYYIGRVNLTDKLRKAYADRSSE